ncbi:MAG: hypothetical protein ACE5FF_04055 [Saprospiraceae bacterium]
MSIHSKLVASIFGEGGRSIRQISAKFYWRGGTPGDEHNWNNPFNWYNRTTPGWYDQVIISPVHSKLTFHPVVDEFITDINQLIVEAGGVLHILPSGKMCIDGLGKKGVGIINEGEILIHGELTIQRTIYTNIRNGGYIKIFGSLALEEQQKEAIVQHKSGKIENCGEIIYL